MVVKIETINLIEVDREVLKRQ
ncbi:Protein of unknown function [Streptococcus thermophilus]|nr:Protein of unknown function [Streptococcus thermophilus]